MKNDPIADAISAMQGVRKAFGAPGDHGYGTPQGDALFALYKAMAALTNHAATDSTETALGTEDARAQALREPAAWVDVLAERSRQISAEGWTPEHDDSHTRGEMALAAICYAEVAAYPDGLFRSVYKPGDPMQSWPWPRDWWKPTEPRRDLVKAGALILAEIERIDRDRAQQTGEARNG